MKKTIQKPDGSTETVEGTAEEIAEYERKIRGDVKESPKPPPGILTDEIKRFIDDVLEDVRKKTFFVPFHPLPVLPDLKPNWPQHSPFCEITVASRGWFSISPPHCTCGAEIRFVDPNVTWTSTSTTLEGHDGPLDD